MLCAIVIVLPAFESQLGEVSFKATVRFDLSEKIQVEDNVDIRSANVQW